MIKVTVLGDNSVTIASENKRKTNKFALFFSRFFVTSEEKTNEFVLFFSRLFVTLHHIFNIEEQNGESEDLIER